MCFFLYYSPVVGESGETHESEGDDESDESGHQCHHYAQWLRHEDDQHDQTAQH